MTKVWILDTETKGTGAHVAPLEDAPSEPRRRERRRRRPKPPRGAAPAHTRKPGEAASETTATPLPAGHVRKKSTGEIGRVRSVDPRAGTATVLWLRGGTTSTVPLSTLSRR